MATPQPAPPPEKVVPYPSPWRVLEELEDGRLKIVGLSGRSYNIRPEWLHFFGLSYP
jgi:hypothetical protein